MTRDDHRVGASRIDLTNPSSRGFWRTMPVQTPAGRMGAAGDDEWSRLTDLYVASPQRL